MNDPRIETRQSAALRWEAFYQRELESTAFAIRAGRVTAEAVDVACRDRRLQRARRAVDALHGSAPTESQVRAEVRTDLARKIARPTS